MGGRKPCIRGLATEEKNKSQHNFTHYYLVLNKTKILYHFWTSVIHTLRYAQNQRMCYIPLHENRTYKNQCILTVTRKEVKMGGISPTDNLNSEFSNSVIRKVLECEHAKFLVSIYTI